MKTQNPISRRCGVVRRNIIAAFVCGVFAVVLFPAESALAFGAVAQREGTFEDGVGNAIGKVKIIEPIVNEDTQADANLAALAACSDRVDTLRDFYFGLPLFTFPYELRIEEGCEVVEEFSRQFVIRSNIVDSGTDEVLDGSGGVLTAERVAADVDFYALGATEAGVLTAAGRACEMALFETDATFAGNNCMDVSAPRDPTLTTSLSNYRLLEDTLPLTADEACDMEATGQESIDGMCQCPAGRTLNSLDACVLLCTNGFEADADGIRCVCPAGEKEEAGVCVEEVICRPDQNKVEGVCLCPTGKTGNEGNSACIDEVVPMCRSDQIDVNSDGSVCECRDGEVERGNKCIIPPILPDVGDSSPVFTSPDKQRADLAAGGAIVGGGMLLVVAVNYLGGGAGAFGFSPDYGYAITESGYAYRYGGRVDYKNDRWNAYWTAAQANANGNTGDLRYGSGGSYKADFWTAAFSESISGETADYNFSLSGNYNGGIWKLSPVYRLHSHFEEDGTSETDNALNLEAVLSLNRWTVRPSAGFRWENAEDFGDKARFGLRAVRRF